MPETVVYIAASLDGFIAREDGSVDWLPDPPEGDDLGWAEFFPTIDAIVMGRNTSSWGGASPGNCRASSGCGAGW